MLAGIGHAIAVLDARHRGQRRRDHAGLERIGEEVVAGRRGDACAAGHGVFGLRRGQRNRSGGSRPHHVVRLADKGPGAIRVGSAPAEVLSLGVPGLFPVGGAVPGVLGDQTFVFLEREGQGSGFGDGSHRHGRGREEHMVLRVQGRRRHALLVAGSGYRDVEEYLTSDVGIDDVHRAVRVGDRGLRRPAVGPFGERAGFVGEDIRALSPHDLLGSHAPLGIVGEYVLGVGFGFFDGRRQGVKAVGHHAVPSRGGKHRPERVRESARLVVLVVAVGRAAQDRPDAVLPFRDRGQGQVSGRAPRRVAGVIGVFRPPHRRPAHGLRDRFEFPVRAVGVIVGRRHVPVGLDSGDAPRGIAGNQQRGSARGREGKQGASGARICAVNGGVVVGSAAFLVEVGGFSGG